jgi:hypothetical protein
MEVSIFTAYEEISVGVKKSCKTRIAVWVIVNFTEAD